ncbi:F-box family protein [Trifolium medium]|uniref:F-box family protein n=1 Tax=Trifolium medium TaxID=97028 RepID=A0A392N7A9_9FABA|nr:F-box family protein [Trifolium medium]
MWILAAIGPRLEELHLYFDYFGISLPGSLFINCTNLVSLSLDGDILVQVKHSSVHFPSLEILRLGATTLWIQKLSFSLAAPSWKL